MSSPVEAKTSSKQRSLDEGCKKRRNEDKESDETASTEHDGRSQTDTEVGESMNDSFTYLESCTDKNTGDIFSCSSVCCSC